ncbi:uncharacterized protein TM35_000261550 [Trypanosoma theileri]|uniref:Uncharacterized protein n=1 Tax=Trypanosoma theileri TaxID=67003 RepID=A0A1X0NQH0_9TRYP|nr:uncharacterized protein TM35_000261550 [Trypanosoma theileri]ORC86703.1 hypothetical protein TM35_000261550 [Trypanosoma theileri]
MGLAPSRRLLYSGSDAPLWFVSAPSELCANEKHREQDNGHTSAVKECVLASTDTNLPPPSFSQLRLVPLIKRYFPSSDSVLFKQLLEARKHQHPRYHFLCKQFLPPTAYIDPTAHYYDLELRESEKESVGNEVYETILPATKAPFSSADVMYELLVENTERILFDNEEELKEAMQANIDESYNNNNNNNNNTTSNNVSGGKSNSGKHRRIRPVPCAVLILRCHGPAVQVWNNNIASFGLANAVEAMSLSPRGRDATVVVEDGRSWLVWEMNGVKMSGCMGGFYGCWTLDELLHCGNHEDMIKSPKSKMISSFPYSSTGPFGLVESSLIVSGCVERDVGEREQPHAWVAACRAFSNTIIESFPNSQLHQNNQHQIPLHPVSMLRQLDLSFIPLLSNIPQMQLCRQVHLFMNIMVDLAPEIPTLAKLQMLLRERNNKQVSGDSRTIPFQGDLNKEYILEAANNTVSGVQRYGGDEKQMNTEESNKGNGVPSLTLPSSSFISLQEKGICSYIADGAVVLRLSNDRVVEALQKLSCIPLSDSTESIVMALTSRVPPPLQYRGELRPPNAYDMCKEKLSGVVRRAEPYASESLLLSWSQLQSQDVFSVGREFDGVPFSFLIAPELPPDFTGGDGGGGDRSNLGTQCPVPQKNPKHSACSGPLKVPNISVSFGDLIRCDLVNGCWYIDRQLHAEDVALSWMRRVAGKARESRDLDEHWLRFPQQEGEIMDEGNEKNSETSSNIKGVMVRLGRFRPWHVQHDGYSYFHCITLRGTGPPPTDAAAAVTTGVGKSTDQGAEAFVNAGTPRAPKKKKGNTTTTNTTTTIPATAAIARTTTTTGGGGGNSTGTSRTTDMIGNRYPTFDGGAMDRYMDSSSSAPVNYYPMDRRMPPSPQNPPTLPLFHRPPSFRQSQSMPYPAAVGSESREEPTLTVSRLVEGWGTFEMERVPSQCSSPSALGPRSHSLHLHPPSLPSPAGTQLGGWDTPGGGSPAAPAALSRPSFSWRGYSPQKPGGTPTYNSAAPHVSWRVPSPFTVSAASTMSYPSTRGSHIGPVPFKIARVPVLNHTSITAGSQPLVNAMESPAYSGISVGSFGGEHVGFAVTPPPIANLSSMDMGHLPSCEARTARPSDNRSRDQKRKIIVSISDVEVRSNNNSDENDDNGRSSGGTQNNNNNINQYDSSGSNNNNSNNNGNNITLTNKFYRERQGSTVSIPEYELERSRRSPYDALRNSSPESNLSLASSPHSGVRLYKNNQQQYRWNPYGSQPSEE